LIIAHPRDACATLLQSPSLLKSELIKKDFVLLLNPFPSQRLTSRCFCAAELMRRLEQWNPSRISNNHKKKCSRAEVSLSLLALFLSSSLRFIEMLFADAHILLVKVLAVMCDAIGKRVTS
jgi:hypothetical protein